MTRLPVPESNTPVVASREEDIVFVDGEGVDDGVVAFEVLHELSFGAEPLFYLAWGGGGGGEGIFGGVRGETADALFVVSQDAHGFAGREVVHPYPYCQERRR